MSKTTAFKSGVKDKQSSKAGKTIEKLPEGSSFKDINVNVDDRGMVFEMFDSRWDWHKDPLVFSYCFTVRPGVIKGWGIHKLHEDRYCIMFGDLELVLYDARPKSKTSGQVFKVYLSEHKRRLINIPTGVWHADRNIGTKDAVVVNYPTMPYDHKNPDKYRLPLDTDEIPYKFHNPQGW